MRTARILKILNEEKNKFCSYLDLMKKRGILSCQEWINYRILNPCEK